MVRVMRPWLGRHGVGSFPGLGSRKSADGHQRAPVAGPVHPLQRCKFNAPEGAPWSAPVDRPRLATAGVGLGLSVAMAFAAAGRWFETGSRDAMCIGSRDIGCPCRCEGGVLRPRHAGGRGSPPELAERSSASSAEPAWAVRLARHPTIRRTKTSMTKATRAKPLQVET